QELFEVGCLFIRGKHDAKLRGFGQRHCWGLLTLSDGKDSWASCQIAYAKFSRGCHWSSPRAREMSPTRCFGSNGFNSRSPKRNETSNPNSDTTPSTSPRTG